MKKSALALGLVGGVLMGVPAYERASAQDSVYVPLFTYRTGPFAGSGTPIADGMRDYLEMLNQRDGGIGGVKILIEECETGYDTKKGVECYEAVKDKKPVMTNPYSTGITLQLIPRASVDKIPMLSMAYGLSASADGSVFPWIFNPPATYWDGASVMVTYMAQQLGGFDKLKGKKLGLIHLDAPFGKEPIPLLENLAKEYGFELKLYPIAAADMQNQSGTWLAIRRDRPDFIYNQGFGAMNPTTVKEAIRNNYPVGKMVGVWWAGGDDDARGGGAEAKGYKALSFNQTGIDYPIMQDIIKHVFDKKLSKVENRNRIGEALYNRGVYNSVLIAEAIRTAQQITGKKVVDGTDVRRGLESLNITEARLKELGMEGFAAPVRVTCADHNGHNKAFVAEWDGAKYVKASDWISPIKDKVRPLIESAAKEYASSNTGWPKRAETCDSPS
ncbi:ABC transporter substrate-binding protein [Beijerinckia sp. 28-YEA-48]|uniref:ABC transporter substrate-binding protein n=1 Tax=unclassified Beijerinckia TaxID=2638183 RepID=UPI000896A6DD|nr:branched-chain amino acid transport system substrate-binding protein [Beijerinckia sp. GAS462]SEC64738.1 amino acid/amide ABC transporter substrate-binding protein, HAAT family [Beijerinckia sp. 28-YEA-48]